MSYNGWSNYETWAAKLWIDNEYGAYLYWLERTKEVYAEAEGSRTHTKVERAELDLMRALESDSEDNVPRMPNGFYSDLLNAALSEVNWFEIARSMMADHVEELRFQAETA